MSKLKLDNRGCGKLLKAGDEVVDRHGIMLCEKCDEKYPAPILAVYAVGHLKDDITIRCGQRAEEAKEQVSSGQSQSPQSVGLGRDCLHNGYGSYDRDSILVEEAHYECRERIACATPYRRS